MATEPFFPPTLRNQATPSPVTSSTSKSAHGAVLRDFVALRAAAEGVERHEPRAERFEPGDGFRVEAGARVGGAADERKFLAQNVVEQHAASVVGANLRLRDRTPLRPIATAPRKAEIRALWIGRRRLEPALAQIVTDLGRLEERL